MGVIYEDEKDDFPFDKWELDSRICFLCAKPLGGYPVVFWAGPPTEIVLHPECARKLSVHLIGDARLASEGADIKELRENRLRKEQGG